MENLVNVYLFGKRYQVPESLTIMKAMEYAGYQLVRGLRLPQRVLRRLCDDLSYQRTAGIKDLPRLPDAGGGGHVCGDAALFPVGEADLRY